MTIVGNDWDEVLQNEYEKSYFRELSRKVSDARTGVVYPPNSDVFRALELAPFSDVKVVIIGQDPYHNEGQANGLAFAVHEGIPLPPSLQNIFEEIKNEYGKAPSSSELVSWAEQGVLLLNSVLTVGEIPCSHKGYGWEQFTEAVVRALNQHSSVVYLLWGKMSESVAKLIAPHHYVLIAPHPSPLSAYRGFFGCNHFINANKILTSIGLPTIDWVK